MLFCFVGVILVIAITDFWGTSFGIWLGKYVATTMAWNLTLLLKVRSYKISEVEGRIVTCRPGQRAQGPKRGPLQGTMVISSHSSLAKAIQNCHCLWLEMRPKECLMLVYKAYLVQSLETWEGMIRMEKLHRKWLKRRSQKLFSADSLRGAGVSCKRFQTNQGLCHPLPALLFCWGLRTWHVLSPILPLGIQNMKSCDDNLRTSCSIPRAVRCVCVGVSSSE